MSHLPFGEMPPAEPRKFVPEKLDCGEWPAIERLFDELEIRLSACKTVPDLENWLLVSGELSSALDEERARRYIAMTCHTDDTAVEAAYLHFVEQVDPPLKPRIFRLAQQLLAHPTTAQLSEDRYRVFLRSLRVMVGLFREQNVALETEEAKLGQRYQKRSGGLTVTYDGREQTLAQMSRYQEEPDRPVREEAWQLVASRRLQDADEFESIFEEQLRLRQKIAENAGFENYRDYAFQERGRFDYGPAECEAFHLAIETAVIPVLNELQEERRRQLGVETLRPWDLAVDPMHLPPLRPFTDVSELEEKTQTLFDRLNPVLAAYFKQLRTLRLLDLANRKGKAPGGYQYTLAESRVPFIFMNAVGQQRDVETLLHEAGHAFHALAARNEPLAAYRDAPVEFSEVASMSMELLGAEHLDVYYDAANARRACRTHLEGIVGVFPWIATIDAFQHWIYTHPNHTRADRREAWLAIMDRFGGTVDWSGFEENRATLWHRQLHLFLHPFYYVEYGIAQLGALQVWANSKRDRSTALADYQAALALGGSRPLPELFNRAGCRFEFSEKTVRPLLSLVRDELNALK